MQTVPNPISAVGLVKRYGDLIAVNGVDLHARRGTCLGLLGPNGAGKTTTMEMLVGLHAPDAGEIRILGHTWQSGARQIRERMGVQLQQTKLHEKLSVAETLRLFASLYANTHDLDELIALIGLVEKRNTRVGELSGGQQQRLALGCALVNRPEVLFLDEPTTGLDPQARRLVWELVDSFKQRGGTVLLTTHYMDEAERLADDLIIVDSGKVIAKGSPSELLRSLGAESLIEYEMLGDKRELPADELARLSVLPGVLEVRSFAGVVTLTVADAHTALVGLMAHVKNQQVRDLRVHRPTLEDVFVALTGKQLRDE